MNAWKPAFRAAVLGLLLAGLPLAASAGGGHGGHGHGGGHHHGGGTRVFVGISPTFWWGAPYGYAPYGYWWGPHPYYYPPAPYYVYAPPVVAEPPVYVERDRAPAPQASSYWYYCESEGAYYPDVETCPEPWVPVPPRSE